MKKSNLIYIQIKNNLVILTHKIDILIALTTFLMKCEEEKKQRELVYRGEGSIINSIHQLFNEFKSGL